MEDKKTKTLVLTALMVAIIFVATYLIRIPNPATGGYSHLGDCMIFLAVVMLGRKSGAAAAALGGALSDLLAGAAVWVVPTLIIKYIMAYIMGTVIRHNPGSRKLQLAGSAIGGLFQIIAYTMVKIALIGMAPAVASIPNVTIQTTVGIVIFMVLSGLLAGRIVNLTERKVQ
ncbi:MAG: ECF transporter S component [Emergencia sp.]|nr:ECF transporter S component [Emergencia sp.]